MSMPSTPRLWALTLVTWNVLRGRARPRGQQMAGIQRGPAGDRFVGIDGAIGLDAGEALQHAGDHRHPRRTADQQDPLHVFPFQAGHAQQLPRGVGSAFQQIGRHLLELFAGDGDFGEAALVVDLDDRPAPRGKRVLGLHGVEVQAVERGRVLAGIELMRLQEALGRVVDQPLVPVVAAKLHVAVGGQGLHLARGKTQEGGVERAAAQVVDQDVEFLRAAGRRARDSPGPRRRPGPRPSAR